MTELGYQIFDKKAAECYKSLKKGIIKTKDTWRLF